MNARDMNHTERYARCIEASKRMRFDIDRDVIRGRIGAALAPIVS